jgi:hypothetical protein
MAACSTGRPSTPTPCSTGPHADRAPDARALLGGDAYTGVVLTVLDNNPNWERGYAERIVTEALKFVHTASLFPTVPISPTEEVDEGWHALILHTRVYAALCSGLGRMVHHYPERPEAARQDPAVLTRTMALIEQAGYTPDAELWTGRQRELVGVARHTPMPGGCGPINPGACATHGGSGDD